MERSLAKHTSQPTQGANVIKELLGAYIMFFLSLLPCSGVNSISWMKVAQKAPTGKGVRKYMRNFHQLPPERAS
ncbi:hypothetical protein KL86DPRO_20512 [uncultured delta proteobacterium]|uniref:Uncharacterized protein n=1 Tax=uncultured delta proteobacterium TaxID=34034 RepID=A0A212K1F2_9DELT|nr:hypothetical protein KL86DPRO_20512 [uncultured delta proteobacterium]